MYFGISFIYIDSRPRSVKLRGNIKGWPVGAVTAAAHHQTINTAITRHPNASHVCSSLQ
jgi:hypothetical protein